GYRANFKRCRFFYNAATDRASVTRVSQHDSCIADWNYGTRPFDYFSLMTNCTIGANFFKSKTSNEKGFCLRQPVDTNNVYVFDCLILGKIYSIMKMRRCAALSEHYEGAKENCEDCIFTNGISLVIDNTTYRPKIGENVAIDRIPLSDDSEAVRDEKDLFGVQRVFNGARDLGALDADWRSHYAKTLGGSRITVVSVDPTVVEENGVLTIPYGSVELTWRNPSDQMVTHLMGLAVYGGGVLSVLKDGEQFVNVDASNSGTYSFRTSDTVAMSFTYNPDAEEDGYAEIGNLTARIGSRILIR
ncbi:MAG: hypothetical protein J6R18_07725, partial [Kiritimatiellae bacterium]|nr:hypothetical protein [Kiritimatiellia bacterium]